MNEYISKIGWYIDDYEEELFVEVFGVLVLGGFFEVVQQVLWNYSFLLFEFIIGIFVFDMLFEDWVMVLWGCFLFFIFWFGVWVGKVINEQCIVFDGILEVVWGYNYYIFEGYFEQGQIEFIIYK